MARIDVVESRHDRLALVEDAGLGRLSFVSVIAGVMTAYGTFVLVLAATGAVLRLAGIDTSYSDADWRRIGTGAGLVVATVVFVSYVFGGYVAGRMARRAGLRHGVMVFLFGVLLAVAAAVLANAATDSDAIRADLREVGIPTSADEWREAGTIVGLASLAAMFVGSLIGGASGERWHGVLLTRALDPAVGTEARLRQRRDEVTDDSVDERHAAAERRVIRARGTSDVTTADERVDAAEHGRDDHGDDVTVRRRPRWSPLRR